MNCTLRRTIVRPDGIFGVITQDDWQRTKICSTAEHSYNGKAKIPPGRYTCIRYVSPKFRHEVFLVTAVPGHDTIEIHRGNWPQVDSVGCILIGEKIIEYTNGAIAINHSALAFEKFMAMQGKNFTLTVL